MGKEYEDIYGRKHIVSEEIARGGQGAVYRTLESNIAIKVEIDSTTGQLVQDEKNNEKFNKIRLLPIPQKINVTLPIVALKGYAGYVMTLLEDMESFSKSFDKELENPYRNDWLNEVASGSEECADGFGQYIKTGGKRRRILAYLKCAAIIAKLHANGLVYCDFSPNNVFISSDEEYSNIWLIDADNLNYQSITSKGGFLTPGYAAPELVAGKGCTFYSDVYSFAISLFYQLTGTHPFKGEMVENGCDEDGFSDDIEELANNGVLPWIFDSDDDRNYTDTMVYQDYILSENLMDIFDRMFCEDSKRNRTKRPSIFEIAEALAYEYDNIVKCPSCEMEHVPEVSNICPWCDKEKQVIRVKSYFSDGSMPKVNLWKFEQEMVLKEEKLIPLRLVEGFDPDNIDSSIFTIREEKNSIFIYNFNSDYEFYNIDKNGEKSILVGEYETKNNLNILCKNIKTDCMFWIEVDFI